MRVTIREAATHKGIWHLDLENTRDFMLRVWGLEKDQGWRIVGVIKIRMVSKGVLVEVLVVHCK